MSTKNYTVKGMTCEHCIASVKEEVSDVAGTQGVEVDLTSGIVTVTGENFTDAAVKAAITEAGYTVVE